MPLMSAELGQPETTFRVTRRAIEVADGEEYGLNRNVVGIEAALKMASDKFQLRREEMAGDHGIGDHSFVVGGVRFTFYKGRLRGIDPEFIRLRAKRGLATV